MANGAAVAAGYDAGFQDSVPYDKNDVELVAGYMAATRCTGAPTAHRDGADSCAMGTANSFCGVGRVDDDIGSQAAAVSEAGEVNGQVAW